MSNKLDPKQSLIITQLNNKLLTIMCDSLMKNDGEFIQNQVELDQPDLLIETNLQGFDTQLVVTCMSRLDSFNRIKFVIELLTYQSQKIATLEMIFNSDNVYEEGTFMTKNEHLITEKLLQFLDQHQQFIITNSF